ncbi:MAG: hypothetical protein ABI776_10235 [Nocardioidaceae bacterium]
MTVTVAPHVIRTRTTRPRLGVTLEAPGLGVTGYVVARQDGSILDVERLDDGHATILLPTYEHEGQETVVVTGPAASRLSP